MDIQWFPGHMNKALREIGDIRKKIDFVIYVLDSRAPYSCLNPELFKILENKPILFVLTKKDMADNSQTYNWLEYFRKNGDFSIAVDATKTSSAKIILQHIELLLRDKLEKDKLKNIKKFYRGAVVGIPNSGKSTLINILCKSAQAKTGNQPGITKSLQWIKIGDLYELLDTPGTLWPKLENKQVALHLAFIGSIKHEILDQTELAFKLIEELLEFNAEDLKLRYKLKDTNKSTIEIFDEICINMGFLLKKGELDYERCSKTLLDDFRKCRIAKITLDKFGSLIGKQNDEKRKN